MEVLLPLLIFAGGVIYSIIASTGNKNEEKRDIDPSKMERPGRSAPRPRPSETGTGQKVERRAGGMFDELKREFQSEYEKAMGRTDTSGEASSGRPERKGIDRGEVNRRIEEQKRQLEERRQREKEQASMRQRSRGQTYEDKRPVERRQSERAERAREKVRTGAVKTDVEIAGATEGIGREIADEVRYSYGDDRTAIHKKGKEEERGFSPKDLTFDNKAIVNGIIFSEVLGKPKSRK